AGLKNNGRGGMIGMKTRFLSVLICAGAASLIFSLFSNAKARRSVDDEQLVCRGIETFKLDSPAPPCEGCINVNTEEPRRYVAFTFVRGSKPSGKGLAPGECSWVNRSMTADEPNQLIQEIEGF